MESIGHEEISTLKSLVDRMQRTTVEMTNASQDYDTNDSSYNSRPRKKLHFTSSDFDLNKSSTDGNSSDCSSLYSTASVNSYLKNYTNVYKCKSNSLKVSQRNSPTNYLYKNPYQTPATNLQNCDNIYSNSSTNSAYSSSSNIYNTTTITKLKNKFKDPNLISKSFLPINTIEDSKALQNLKDSLKFENLSEIDKIIHDNALLRLCLPKWVNNKTLPHFETQNLNLKVKKLIETNCTAEIDLNQSETLIDSNESKTDLNSTFEYKNKDEIVEEEDLDQDVDLDPNCTIILNKTLPKRRFSPLPSSLVKNVEMNSLLTNSPSLDSLSSISARKNSLDFTSSKSSTPRIKNNKINYQKRIISNSRASSPAPINKIKSSISRRCTSSISPTNKPIISKRVKTTKPSNLSSKVSTKSSLGKTKLSKVSSNKLNDSLKPTVGRARNFSPLPSKASFNHKSGNVSLVKSRVVKSNDGDDYADPRLKHLPHGKSLLMKQIDENNNTVKNTSTESISTKKTKSRLPGIKSTKSFGFRGKK